MSITFLCNKHKAWFAEQPEQAIYECFKTYEAGRFHYHNDNLEGALFCSGSAFEMAEIMFTAWISLPENALNWLTATSKALMRVMKKLGMNKDCLMIYQRSIVLLGDIAHRDETLKDDAIEKMGQLAQTVFMESQSPLKSVDKLFVGHHQLSVVLH